MNPPTHVASVLTPDRVGIIHAIVRELDVHEVSVLDISQTVVHGAFTIVLVLSLPSGLLPEAIQAGIRGALGSDAAVVVADYTPVKASRTTADSYILTAMGPATPNIVSRLTQTIAQQGGSFSDFSSQMIEGRLQLVAEVQLPAEVALSALQAALTKTCGDERVVVRLQHHRLFVATNEIAFRHNL